MCSHRPWTKVHKKGYCFLLYRRGILSINFVFRYIFTYDLSPKKECIDCWDPPRHGTSKDLSHTNLFSALEQSSTYSRHLWIAAMFPRHRTRPLLGAFTVTNIFSFRCPNHKLTSEVLNAPELSNDNFESSMSPKCSCSFTFGTQYHWRKEMDGSDYFPHRKIIVL